MFLPTKFIAPDRSLLSIGAQILLVLDVPLSVSGAWEAVKEWRVTNRLEAPLPFWWFALALDSLFAMKAIDADEGLIVRKSVD